MSSRPLTWALFALCLAAVLGGMGWVTATALELDEAQTEAEKKAELEDAVRLSLWRMDSALTPFIAQETGRPHRFYTDEGEKTPTELVRAHLLYDEVKGRFSTPDRGRSGELIALAIDLDAEALQTIFPEDPVEQGELLALARNVRAEKRRVSKLRAKARKKAKLQKKAELAFLGTKSAARQRKKSRAEWGKRAQAVQKQVGNYLNPTNLASTRQENEEAEKIENAQAGPQGLSRVEARSVANLFGNGSGSESSGLNAPRGFSMPASPRLVEVATGTMRPLWLQGKLLMLRRAEVDGRRYLEGAWLDWPAIEATLLAEVEDLLPGAQLLPATAPDDDAPRLLATLPVRLLPGSLPEEAIEGGLRPLQVSLIIAWACVLFAALAVFGLLLGAMNLSERRGAFVSAVTHELRTPLTTFRMYTEMLSEGMVGEEKRGLYIETLRREADRLAALVENVLAYARIEGKRYTSRMETIALSDLFERVAPRLRERAAQGGLELTIADSAPGLEVRADPQALEQILFNLVDNAAKYAGPGGGPIEIAIEAPASSDRLTLRVRDQGPGVPPGDRRRIFRPFAKSSQHLAGTAAGVGLGLALCLRLARQMHGDLKLEALECGASFALVLRRP